MLRHTFPYLFLLLSLPVLAQYPGFKPAADPATFKQKFTEQTKALKSISSDFEQEKQISLLSEKIMSKGKFWFRQDNKVRMEYITPSPYLVIMDADKINIRSGERETAISTNSNRLLKQLSRIVSDCVSGSIVSNPDFTTKVFESGDQFLVEMNPTDKNLKGFFNTILVYTSKKTYDVNKVELLEPSGDSTVIRFLNKQTNVTLPDSLFHL